jgi:predicted dehydrogenase
MQKLRIGLFGVGHLGRIHLKCILLSDQYELVGVFDPDNEAITKAQEQNDFQRYTNADELIKEVDVVDIVVPTIYHFEIAKKALSEGKHVFIEKPVTKTSKEAKELKELAESKSLKIQVGHVERFNPAFLALRDLEFSPAFIEGHRLAHFNPRGTDVSVVYDLMIHDLDIVLSLISSDVDQVQANGVSIVSEQADICNARIQFKNGAVANLTASRISLKNMRKLRLFQRNAYISMDFLKKSSEIIQLKESDELNAAEKDKYMKLELPDKDKYISVQMPEIQPVNAILMELESLAEAIHQNTDPLVNIEDGLKALELAEKISESLESSQVFEVS